MPSPSRFPALDGFRGAAVLAVVLFHYVIQTLQVVPGSVAAYLHLLSSFLWMGVDAFFVLSGFLIGGILMDQRGASNYYRVFYLRRSLRIFPSYFLLLLCWLLAEHTLAPQPGASWLLDPPVPHWPYWLYVQNFLAAIIDHPGPLFVGVTWSLAVEEQFYLAFPFVVRRAQPGAIHRVLIAGIFAAPLLRVACSLLGDGWGTAEVWLLFTRSDSLCLGALIAWVFRNPAALQRVTAARTRVRAATCVLGLAVAALPILTHQRDASLTAPWILSVIAAFFCLVLLQLQLGWLPRVGAVLSSGILRFFGRISYTMYLFHSAILGLVFALLGKSAPILGSGRDALLTALAFVLSVLFAQACWTLFEGRLVRLGHRSSYLRPAAAIPT